MAQGKNKPPPPPDPEIEKLKGKLKRKMDNLDKVSDVLTGKDIPDGTVGNAIRMKRQLEQNNIGGKKIRDKKYKAFDEWIARQQRINNLRNDAPPPIRIKRRVVVDEGGTLY